MKHISIIIFALLTVSTIAYTQDSYATAMVNQILEEMAADGTLTEEFEEEAANLIALAEEKINLNTCTYEQLACLFFLTDKQRENIIWNRERFGPYYSDIELITLPDFSLSDVQKLLTFAYVNEHDGSKLEPRTARLDILGRVQRSFPKAKGFKSKNDSIGSPYLGTPYKTLMRINGSIGKTIKGGLVAESDVGEPMFSHGISTFDFVSGFLSVKPQNKFLRKLIVGHYSAHFGQGLGLWTGFSVDMSSVQSSIAKFGDGINGTMSASESGYLRGGAMQFGNKKFTLDIFASHTDNDATTYVDIDSTLYSTTIQTDGYHRTVSELAGRNNFQQILYGGYFRYTSHNWSVAAGFNQWNGSTTIGNSGEIYKLYYPTYQNLGTVHTDYRCYIKKCMIYGEVAFQTAETFAGMQAIDIDLGNGNSMTVGYRKFGRKYYNFYQRPFSRATHPGGETGTYISILLSPFAHTQVLANVNIYHNEWLQYQKPAPTSGYKARINLTYSFNDKNNFSLRYRNDNYEDSDLDNRVFIERTQRNSFKLVWTSQPIDNIRFKTTIENVHFRQDNRKSNGFWAGEEITLTSNENKASLSVLLAHFDTDDYYSRIYASQPDVLYSMSMPSYYGTGVLAIAKGKLTIARFVDLWLWSSYVKYYDRTTIGSSYNEIDSSHKIDTKLQIRFKLRYWKRRNSSLSKPTETSQDSTT